MYAIVKEVLRINENLDIGGVRKPLANIIDSDKELAKEVAKMINKVREEFKDC